MSEFTFAATKIVAAGVSRLQSTASLIPKRPGKRCERRQVRFEIFLVMTPNVPWRVYKMSELTFAATKIVAAGVSRLSSTA
jgi:hypothetical protein